MIKTEDLILDKGRIGDYRKMYENVWSRKEAARYMFWNLTESEEDALGRMERTIAFQKEHDTYLVYERKSGDPIGFAGVELFSEGVCEEAGICLGPDYVGRGYGKQILEALISYSRERYGAHAFIYSSRKDNAASIGLARSMGFEYFDEISRFDPRDGLEYTMIRFRKEI